VLDYVVKQRAEVIAKLSKMEREALQLRGALAALDDVLEHVRKPGGGSVAAPAPAMPAPDKLQPLMASASSVPQGVKSAVRIGHAPLQADQELRE
jgi:hypothetical protein